MEGIISFSDWQKINLRVGKITKAEDIEGADKLYKLEVDLGKAIGKRILCAGIKQYYKKEDLKGRKIVVVENLQPRKMRGIESQGMLLAAVSDDESSVVLIKPKTDVIEGEKVEFKESSKSYKSLSFSLAMEEKEWLKKAKEDLKAAGNSLKSKDYGWSCFQSQQAVEKALKALYIKKYKRLLKVHDLVLLAKKIDAPKEIINYCNKINPSYIDTRYLDTLRVYIEDDAKNILNLASMVLKWIEKNL